MMGRRLEDTVTLELEDFVAWLRNTYRPAQGINAGDGPAGPIVGQQAMVWHEALCVLAVFTRGSACSRDFAGLVGLGWAAAAYRTLRIAQETTSCSNRRCVEPERIRQHRRAWQGAERESAELVAAADTAAALFRSGLTRPG